MAGRSDVRVLVVEDDYLISALIQGILTQLGYAVAGWASGGELAVEMAESLRPDVILMDMKLPDTDGIEATRRIQERRPTPVVMMTAYDNAGLVQRASTAGVCAYLVKPPDAGQIERALIVARARFDDLVELRRLNEQLVAEVAERRRAEEALAQANAALEQRLREIKTLRGYLPICASCKKIRDDRGYWHAVEVYIHDHTGADFTHGICPDCAQKMLDGLDLP